MAITATNSTTQAQAADPSSALSSATAATSTLGKDAFMKLLVAQISHQDPLKPMDDTAFVSQLAQFSALEQMNNVSSSLDRLTASSELTQGAALSGRTITYQLDDNSDPVTGVVGKVTVDKGTAMLDVNGVSVPLSAVQEIDPPGAGA